MAGWQTLDGPYPSGPTIEAITLKGKRTRVAISSLIPRVSAYLLCIDRGEVLLLPHRQAKTLGCPGGEVEKGDTHEQTLYRECKEEIGTDQIIIGPLAGVAENIFSFDGKAYQTHMIFYQGHVSRELVKDTRDKFEGPPGWYKLEDLKIEQFPILRVNNIYHIIMEAAKHKTA